MIRFARGKRQARLAIERIARSVGRSANLILPLPENPTTGYSESVRNPGVLTVTIDPLLDRDYNGIADADNDGDGLVDEDAKHNANNDGEPGVEGIDDDGDGSVDEGDQQDDDQDSTKNEDPLDGLDEQLGLQIDLGRLLAVDHVAPTTKYPEGFMFVFSGGVLRRSDIDRIRLQSSELSDMAFLPAETALTRLRTRLSVRVESCLTALAEGTTLYLEQGRRPA